jgi:hypothetical protein
MTRKQITILTVLAILLALQCLVANRMAHAEVYTNADLLSNYEGCVSYAHYPQPEPKLTISKGYTKRAEQAGKNTVLVEGYFEHEGEKYPVDDQGCVHELSPRVRTHK